MSDTKNKDTVYPLIATWILDRQKKCQLCGINTNNLHLHHRIWRSQRCQFPKLMQELLQRYKDQYQRDMSEWGIHDIQNLVVLCNRCHTEVHSNYELKMKFQNSITCNKTGFNINIK